MSIHEKVQQWEREEGVRLFQNLGLPRNAAILDYGCGFGHYSIAASRFLGGKDGQVYAVDINKDCLKHVSKVADEEGLVNIITAGGNKDYSFNFSNDVFDMIMFYDLLHGDGFHRFTLYEEASRTLKKGGILSILPFHLSNFRDKEGKKTSYSYRKLVLEAQDYGFTEIGEKPLGIHFEKYHSAYYINKGGVEFENLERAEILNLQKN
ncbi:class I SAM-dependent methyltransferase [Paenibacillus pedocola]|uniref:class I SAM-dependent methyltransferase n=1 Tax=Paenibacillus pedocola TaxID=3242193 RepID=UPI00287758CC|nr:class I SAM-dependent methyltransferase [Paenibacillus typhae]